MIDTLRQVAKDTRGRRLNGKYHHGTDHEHPLVGYCFDNAYVLINALDEHDRNIDYTLIEGTTERVADDLRQQGINPRALGHVEELAGLVHYWVEATEATNDKRYWIDIASDTWDYLGELLVQPAEDFPDDYIVLPDSRDEGTATLQMVRERDDRCKHCGGERYTNGGCQHCQ